ncbi:UBP1-associated protein 2A-like [Papaver somniferum]|uniref:UBP1-associated protein 2A-like n=1 Tax=Papaver somniferum TaxID=3469 RepID=UPI000E6F63FD|nr:UBP1-associated protein 2A-like [Papaver somniferum]
MAMKRRYEDEVDTELEMDSELDDAQVEEEELEETEEEDEETETEEEEEKETEEEEEEEEDITKLLEPFSKKQLIDIICSVSTENREIIQEVRKRADQDPSHCELFVHGLDWETTSDQFKEIFSTYGDIIQCRIVVDRVTGQSKGYGFVLYKHRKSVSKALREPLKKIGNRIAMCHLASNQQKQRKIFVGNVDSETSSLRLHSFFSKYGEIEEGPIGFDKYTGKFRGYAMFIYKTVGGARRAVEEPIKRFDGYIIYCQMATDQRQKFGLGIGGFSPYTQNGVAQPYVQGIFSGAAQPYYGQGTQHVQAMFAPAGQNPSAYTGSRPAYMSPATSQQGIPGAFGMGNSVCQNPQSYEPNFSCKIASSGDGPAERCGLGYYLKKLGLFIMFVVCMFVLNFIHSSLKI